MGIEIVLSITPTNHVGSSKAIITIGRPKKKPSYDAAAILSDLIAAVTESYNTPDSSGASDDGKGTEHKPLKRVAEEFEITPLKVRKLLITGGVFKSPICNQVNTLYKAGKTITQIQKATGLGRASVHSYLPYSKCLYNANELSTDAERVRVFRARKAALMSLNGSIDTLWDAIKLFAGFPFYTAKGLKFTYSIRGNEMFVDRKDKAITRASVELAYNTVQALSVSGRGGVASVSGPKKIGTFGASYIYPIFVRFGVIKTDNSALV